MNEEPTMERDDVGTHIDDSGSNGRTHRIPEWGNEEFVPSRRRNRLWERIMASKTVRSIADHNSQAERQPVPAWLPTVVVTVALFTFTQAGYLIYKLSHYDTVEDQTVSDIETLRDDLHAQDQYNQLIVIYENKIQNILVQKGIKLEELPDVPKRPTLPSKRRHRREN